MLKVQIQLPQQQLALLVINKVSSTNSHVQLVTLAQLPLLAHQLLQELMLFKELMDHLQHTVQVVTPVIPGRLVLTKMLVLMVPIMRLMSILLAAQPVPLVIIATKPRKLNVKLVSIVTRLPLQNGISSVLWVPMLPALVLIVWHVLSALVATHVTRKVLLATQHQLQQTTTSVPRVTSVLPPLPRLNQSVSQAMVDSLIMIPINATLSTMIPVKLELLLH